MAAGVKLYAISYDDGEALAEFREKQDIPYPLLSDVDSAAIRRYGIPNDRIRPGDALLHGITYPGVFVRDEDGVVISKSFHDTHKNRDSPERLLDAALGRVVLDGNVRTRDATRAFPTSVVGPTPSAGCVQEASLFIPTRSNMLSPAIHGDHA